MSTTNQPRPGVTVVALSTKVVAVVTGHDGRISLVRETASTNGDAVISLTPSAEDALLELLLKRKGLAISFLRP